MSSALSRLPAGIMDASGEAETGKTEEKPEDKPRYLGGGAVDNTSGLTTFPAFEDAARDVDANDGDDEIALPPQEEESNLDVDGEGLFGGFKKRWVKLCVLANEGRVDYFENATKEKFRGSIPLKRDDAAVNKVKDNSFEICWNNGQEKLVFRAYRSVDRDKWVDRIEDVLQFIRKDLRLFDRHNQPILPNLQLRYPHAQLDEDTLDYLLERVYGDVDSFLELLEARSPPVEPPGGGSKAMKKKNPGEITNTQKVRTVQKKLQAMIKRQAKEGTDNTMDQETILERSREIALVSELRRIHFAKKMLTDFYVEGDVDAQGDLDSYRKQHPEDPDLRKLSTGAFWRVKLVLTTIPSPGKTVEKLGKLFLGSALRYGTVHAALMVGPVFLEWGLDSLCIPVAAGELKSKRALVMLDVAPSEEHDDAQFVSEVHIDALCRTISSWNVRKIYGRASGNCQQFVDACLHALGIDFMTASGTETQRFMERLTSGTAGDLVEFQLGDRKFISHQDLDDYYSQHKDTLSYADRMLLKAYDRAYWLRHFDLLERTLYPPPGLTPEEEEAFEAKILSEKKLAKPAVPCCPFQDPRDTPTMNHGSPVAPPANSGRSGQSGKSARIM